MCMGVATAKVSDGCTCEREQRDEGKGGRDGRSRSRFVRMRTVLMTALAMIMECVPMAVGLGEGGSKKKRLLARAVIGGLIF